ncbi:MAG: hypothetical protein GZ094_06410 [Mariniphaga sp.]|nr:hypothetical protein [Mariniphaga sp.]
MESLKSLCLFIHFHHSNKIPYYVQLYVNELARFFDEVVLLSNQQQAYKPNELSENIQVVYQENKGYDFGRFYQYIRTIDLTQYQRIACVNDSNVLIKSLDGFFAWEKLVNFDMIGLLDSFENPPFSTFKNPYHIQSHFLVFHTRAIALLATYYKSVDTARLFGETNSKKLRRGVINYWELGVSNYMTSNGLQLGAYFKTEEMAKKFQLPKETNSGLNLSHELVKLGYPVIKKKAIFEWNWKLLRGTKHWTRLILEEGNPEWDHKRLIKELYQFRYNHRITKISRLIHT